MKLRIIKKTDEKGDVVFRTEKYIMFGLWEIVNCNFVSSNGNPEEILQKAIATALKMREPTLYSHISLSQVKRKATYDIRRMYISALAFIKYYQDAIRT